MSFCSFIREQNPSGPLRRTIFGATTSDFHVNTQRCRRRLALSTVTRELWARTPFLSFLAEVLIFHLLVEDKIFLKHPRPRSTERDRWLQMLDPRYYQTHVWAFSESSHQVYPPSAERLQESLTAHISGEILTAALLFLFQCSG